MKNNTKIALYIIGGLTLSVGGFLFYDKLKSNKKDGNVNEGGDETNTGGENNTNVDNTIVGDGSNFIPKFPLRDGSQGMTVYIVQSALIKLGQDITLNGVWDEKTYDGIYATDSWIFGFNTICNIGKSCPFVKSNYDKLLQSAYLKGFDYNKAVLEAKAFFK
jgi:hypothetical protein